MTPPDHTRYKFFKTWVRRLTLLAPVLSFTYFSSNSNARTHHQQPTKNENRTNAETVLTINLITPRCFEAHSD